MSTLIEETAAAPATAESKPAKAAKKATRTPRRAPVAPKKAKAGKKATPAKKAPKGAKKAKGAKAGAGARDGSKTAAILDLLKRPGGARALQRSCSIASKARPSPSSVAALPLSCCQRCTITLTYFESSSMP